MKNMLVESANRNPIKILTKKQGHFCGFCRETVEARITYIESITSTATLHGSTETVIR